MNSSHEAIYGYPDRLIANSSHHFFSPEIVSSLGTIVLLILVSTTGWHLNRSGKLSVPVVRATKDHSDMNEVLEEAKRMYPNQAFMIPLHPPQVILPNNLLNEIKNMPDDQISFRKAIYSLMLGKYTGIGMNHAYLVEAIKFDLTRNISKTLSDLQDEVTFAVEKEFGRCNEWTPVEVQQSLSNTVARVSARVFVGLPLCRDDDWIKATTRHSGDVAASFKAISKYPFYIRPFVAPFLAELRALKAARRRVGEMIRPTVATILKSSKSVSSDLPGHDNQYNMISWILRQHKPDEKLDIEEIVHQQLLAGLAAIHTTSLTLSQAIYDLASYPQYISELRAEIDEISAEDPDRKLRKTTMPKLHKLDSFLKESQRMHPLSMTSLQRIITAKKGLTLSTGLHLPYGTFLSVAHPQMTDNVTYQENPELPQPPFGEFHPFRYSDMRSHEGEESKHQFVTTSPESVSFGHGQWACPGRFFASNEIKILLVELLRNYDLGLGPNGEGLGGEFQRPKTSVVDISLVPDPTAKIFFRRRQ